MIEKIFNGLIFFLIFYGIVMLLVRFFTMTSPKTERLKDIRWIISVCGGLLITIFFLFFGPTGNDNTATIKTYDGKFLLTLTGDRLPMVHDPISLFKTRTYKDTLTLILPRKEGVIEGREIPAEKGTWKLKGQIQIEGDNVDIELFYDNRDKNIEDPLSWNDDYKLKWVK